jgi:hypothetical protein
VNYAAVTLWQYRYLIWLAVCRALGPGEELEKQIPIPVIRIKITLGEAIVHLA